jgi:hypothetical protein
VSAALRLWYLNRTLKKPLAPIKVGESLKEFLEIETKIEKENIPISPKDD